MRMKTPAALSRRQKSLCGVQTVGLSDAAVSSSLVLSAVVATSETGTASNLRANERVRSCERWPGVSHEAFARGMKVISVSQQ